MQSTRVSIAGLMLGAVLAAGCAAAQPSSSKGGSAAEGTDSPPVESQSTTAQPTTGETSPTTGETPPTTGETPPTDAVTGTIQVDATIPDNKIEFGVVQPGGNGTASIEVFNKLDPASVMHIADISVEGSAFELTEDNCTGVDVASQNMCSITISFKPTNVATYVGTADIIASYELELNVPLTGTGG